VIDKRLRQLFDELIADKGYISGRRSFPRTLTEDDAVEIVGALHAEMDQAAAHRAASARRMGKPLACGPGCTGCCEEMVMVFRPEVLRIVRWLQQPEHASVKDAFLAAYPAWKARAGDAGDRIAALYEGDDEGAHVDACIAYWTQRNLCAFNQGGMCTIYDVRPLVCRNAHAVGTADLCRAERPEGMAPTRVVSKQFDSWVLESRGRICAAHHAIGGPRMRAASLCDAVHAMLTAE
jgi:Fe-S-cluster containining protein